MDASIALLGLARCRSIQRAPDSAPPVQIPAASTHLRQIPRDYETHHTQHRPHRSLHGAAPLKPLPEPAGPGQCRVRKQARAGGLIGEYRLVA